MIPGSFPLLTVMRTPYRGARVSVGLFYITLVPLRPSSTPFSTTSSTLPYIQRNGTSIHFTLTTTPPSPPCRPAAVAIDRPDLDRQGRVDQCAVTVTLGMGFSPSLHRDPEAPPSPPIGVSRVLRSVLPFWGRDVTPMATCSTFRRSEAAALCRRKGEMSVCEIGGLDNLSARMQRDRWADMSFIRARACTQRVSCVRDALDACVLRSFRKNGAVDPRMLLRFKIGVFWAEGWIAELQRLLGSAS
ncbi:hypothetical protein R3P38DRAFT_1457014 [Favolaschia claudopus]|uniref:Uncharacterized protein n=1 Tax=Favolaschia claudopus TaxID=2862362 RepID=A0AAW0ALJ4_9AGAR